jgi:hypothetical protein
MVLRSTTLLSIQAEGGMTLVEVARQTREANHGTTLMRILRHFEIHLELNHG